MSKKQGMLFLELANPNDDGCSRVVPASEFTGDYQTLHTTNGGGWCRSDGKDWLGKIYKIKRHKHKGRISGVELCGFL